METKHVVLVYKVSRETLRMKHVYDIGGLEL